MKNIKKFLKITVAFALVAIMLVSLVACATSDNTSSVGDTEGSIEGTSITWKYTKSDQTLEINGSGDIPDAAKAEDVSWTTVATSVKVVKINATDVTKIGDYAFYYMNQLESITIPEGVVSIGKSAFAFTKNLKSVTLPKSLNTVGERAFEASGLTHINLPDNVKNLGDYAFAHCMSLENVVIRGAEKIEPNTFSWCTGLKTLAVPTALMGEFTINDKLPKINAIDAASASDAIAPPAETAPVETTSSDTSSEDADAPTETTAAPVEDEKLGFWEIFAIVALVILVIAVIVGVVLYIQYDKKHSGNTTTVVKNKDGKGKKNGKNNKKDKKIK